MKPLLTAPLITPPAPARPNVLFIATAGDSLHRSFFYSPFKGNEYKAVTLNFKRGEGIDQFGREQASGPGTQGKPGTWEHRVIGLCSSAPGVLPRHGRVFKGGKPGTYKVPLDNLRLRHAYGTISPIWTDGKDTRGQVHGQRISQGYEDSRRECRGGREVKASLPSSKRKHAIMISTLLRFAAAFLLLSNVSFATAAASGSANPPRNVLFLVVDDLNSWLLGDADRYAGRVVAPNIQRLAASGVVFHRAYTAAPVCSPSRTAMLSGVRPWQSGVYDNGLDIDRSAALQKVTPFPALLKATGYSVASFGKISHGWDFKESCDASRSHKRDPQPPRCCLSLPFTKGEQDWGPRIWLKKTWTTRSARMPPSSNC